MLHSNFSEGVLLRACQVLKTVTTNIRIASVQAAERQVANAREIEVSSCCLPRMGLDAWQSTDMRVPYAQARDRSQGVRITSFQKKAPARKARASGAVHGFEGADGSALSMGRRGGLVRVSSST